MKDRFLSRDGIFTSPVRRSPIVHKPVLIQASPPAPKEEIPAVEESPIEKQEIKAEILSDKEEVLVDLPIVNLVSSEDIKDEIPKLPKSRKKGKVK